MIIVVVVQERGSGGGGGVGGISCGMGQDVLQIVVRVVMVVVVVLAVSLVVLVATTTVGASHGEGSEGTGGCRGYNYGYTKGNLRFIITGYLALRYKRKKVLHYSRFRSLVSKIIFSTYHYPTNFFFQADRTGFLRPPYSPPSQQPTAHKEPTSH